MKTEDIRVELGFNCIQIYFLDTLHLRVTLSDMIGIQSWKSGTKNFIIEYTMRQGSVRTEYDVREYWVEILSQLDRLLNRYPPEY